MTDGYEFDKEMYTQFLKHVARAWTRYNNVGLNGF